MHPPFQIDGNFGAVAGVTEMLIQSHEGSPNRRTVELLPALPPSWKKGFVKGLRARGGFVFDIFWENGKPYKVCVTSENKNTLCVKINTEHIQTVKQYALNGSVLKMDFEKGETAEINFNRF
jgi:alpha-L-fucosidase 2